MGGGFACAPGMQELLINWLRAPAGPGEAVIHGALVIPSPEGIPSGVQCDDGSSHMCPNRALSDWGLIEIQ